MEPTTAAMIAKAAIAVGTNKKVWTGIASVIAALCLPFILIIVCILSIASGGADHNRSAVRLAFEGGNIPSGMPADYREYIGQMQESFGELDTVLGEIDSIKPSTQMTSAGLNKSLKRWETKQTADCKAKDFSFITYSAEDVCTPAKKSI